MEPTPLPELSLRERIPKANKFLSGLSQSSKVLQTGNGIRNTIVSGEDSGREAAFFTPHLQLFIFHCHHISEFSHQGLKLINVHSGHVIGAYVRLQDLLL